MLKRHLLWLLLALAGPNPASAAPPDSTSRADRAAWAAVLRQKPALEIEHLQKRARRVFFLTKLPCVTFDPIRRGRVALPGDQAQGITQLLAELLEGPTPAPGPARACAEHDHFAMVFRAKGKPVSVQFAPAWKELCVSDDQQRPAVYRLGGESAALLAHLAEAMPDDARLPAIKPCTDSSATTDGDDGWPSLCDPAFVDSLPRALRKVYPDYPDEARATARQGTVVVRALVSVSGAVTRTGIAHSNDVLDEPAVRAVEQWLFKPATIKGRPVALWVSCPIRFVLD